MKRTLFFFLLIALALTGCKSKEKVSQPEDIGPQVMDILEEMNDLTRPEFSEYFISYNDLQEIMKDDLEGIDEEQRRSLLLPTKKEMKVRYNFMHMRLKSQGKRHGINWEKIKFVSFDHEMTKRGSAKLCYGVLTFKYRSTHFTAQTASIYDGSNYILTSITNVNEKR